MEHQNLERAVAAGVDGPRPCDLLDDLLDDVAVVRARVGWRQLDVDCRRDGGEFDLERARGGGDLPGGSLYFDSVGRGAVEFA